MKKMKKLMALALALVMATALAVVPASAAYNKTTIQITNALKGVTYAAYQLLDLSYNEGAYTYTVNSAWAEFFNQVTIKGVYVDIDSSNYVTWKMTDTSDEDADGNTTEEAGMAALAKMAEAWLSTHSIAPSVYQKADVDGIFSLGNVDAGYYLITSTAGTAAILNTATATGNTLSVNEKNTLPSVEKKVNSQDTDVAHFNETLTYTVTVTAEASAENYCLVDTLGSGLTFDSVSSIVHDYADTDKSDTTLYTSNPTDTDVITPSHSGQILTVNLSDYCAGNDISNGDKFVITYTATLNNNAVIADTGNINNVTLYYGSDGTDTDTLGDLTKTSSATVYTYQLDVTKVDADKYTTSGSGTKEYTTKLAGAEFILYYTDGSTTKYAQVDANGKLTSWTEDKDNASTLTTDPNGAITVKGLGDATYTLEETKAPAGYQLPSDTTSEVIISNANATVTVENSTGTELPSTGGIGTTIFYTMGGILVLAALVLLVSKKRVQE